MTFRALLVVIAVTAAAGLLFAFFPELDIAVTRLFVAPDATFTWAARSTLGRLRDASMVVVGLLAAPAGAALILRILFPNRPMLMGARAAVFLLTTLALGPGLAANIGLKDNWGRPRPRAVVEFGGKETFVPWWDPRGTCPNNCSFVAGEASGAFWTIAPAALAPPHWRTVTYGAALVFGTAVGLLRISFGGHFLSDVIFAGAFTFIIIWLVYAMLFRWTRISDRAINRVLAFPALTLGKLLRRNSEAELAPRPRSLIGDPP